MIQHCCSNRMIPSCHCRKNRNVQSWNRCSPVSRASSTSLPSLRIDGFVFGAAGTEASVEASPRRRHGEKNPQALFLTSLPTPRIEAFVLRAWAGSGRHITLLCNTEYSNRSFAGMNISSSKEAPSLAKFFAAKSPRRRRRPACGLSIELPSWPRNS